MTCKNCDGVYRKWIFLLTIFFFTFSSLFATDPIVKYLGIEQGLSNNMVTKVYQDYNGFMWFGTYDGLSRYDGYGFKISRNIIGDSTSLSTNAIATIEGDANHNIWVGGQNGACVFNPVTSAFYKLKYRSPDAIRDEIVPGPVHIIKAVADRCMLVGSDLKGLLVYENNATTGRQIPLINEKGIQQWDYSVTAIEYDSYRKVVWLIISNYGLYTYSIKEGRLNFISGSFKDASCLKITKQKKLWLGNANGIYQYNSETNTFSGNMMPVKSNVINLCDDAQNVLWIATDGGGVYTLDNNADKATALLSAAGTPLINSNAISDVYEDKEGRKWIGTLRGGINIIESRNSPFQTIVYNIKGISKPVDNFILSFCEDEKNNVWIGTDGAGLRYWDRQKDTYYEYKKIADEKNAISSNFITGITRDFQNDIWVSTWFGGINRLRKNAASFEKYTCYNPFSKNEENNVWFLYEDKQHDLWASATNSGSLFFFNRQQNKFEIFDPGITNLQSIAEDSYGNFWGGNYSSLIKIDRLHKKSETYTIGYPVRCIHEDKNKNLWVGTQDGGLLLFNRKTGDYTRYTTQDGLPSNTILRLLEDQQGNLWLSTFNGLSEFNPRTKKTVNFSQSDGLQSNQFSFNAALQLQSGEFLFGGIKGFNIFQPATVQTSGGIPPIFLNGLRINNKIVNAGDGHITKRILDKIEVVTIPYNEALLSIDFIAQKYTGAEKINYAYYLEGWDKDWNYVNTIRTANYSRLQEGSYFFKIKITKADGTWSGETQLFKIIVLPPWYRTWWAYLLYLISICAVLYFYISYKTRQEKLKYEIKLAHFENEKEKEVTEKKLSFFTNISHEFRTPLTLIINPLKENIENTDNQEENKSLTTAYRNARRLLSLVDQLLLFRQADKGDDMLKISTVDISELCTEVYQCFIQIARKKQIEYVITVPKEPVEVFADYERIEIAVFNLLSNAFKFTADGGHILLEVKHDENEALIVVKDNGCGINEAEKKMIFEKFQRGGVPVAMQKTGFGIGLYLVKHFVESHNGTILCESELNKGTSFTISLKKNKAHLPENYFIEQPGKKFELLQELAGATEQPVTQVLNTVKKTGKKAEEVISEKKSVLIIDDDIEIRQYLRQIFEKEYLVYEGCDGNEGFTLASLHMPDLIITDINMDGMDGVELCNKIKQSEILGHIPVILLTSATASDTRLKGIKEGADDYITKPFDKEILLARVESLLRSRQVLQKYFFDSITLKKTSIKVPAEFQEFLKKCIEIVEENIDTEDFTIKKFSKAMGMSHSGLYQKVRSISGQSLNAFIRSIRLRRAAVLMLSENMNISQAAFQVGINDPKYFREQFVKLFGMTPSDYIKKYRDSFNRDFNVLKEE